jgi:hypothetical protein
MPSSSYVIVESAIPSRWLNATNLGGHTLAQLFGTQGGRTDVHPPFLPFKYTPIYLETNAFGLDYMQRLGCLALLPFIALPSCSVLDEVWKEVLRCEGRRNARTLQKLQLVLVQQRRLC